MCGHVCGEILLMKVFETGSLRRVARDAGRDIITHGLAFWA
jgi:hypothetical protein